MRFWWNPVQRSRGRRWLWSSVQVLCVNNPQKWRCLCLWFQSKPKWKRSLNCKIRVWGLDKFPTALPGWGCRYQWLMSIWVVRLCLIRDSIRALRALEKHWGVRPVSLCEVVTLIRLCFITLQRSQKDSPCTFAHMKLAPFHADCPNRKSFLLSRLIKSVSFSLCGVYIFYSVF